MIKKILTGIWVVLVTVIVVFPNSGDAMYQWIHGHVLGSTNFPTSLDSTSNLPNPSATDSVATVSHSALHTNENLGIIATETKVGIGASTPTLNTLLAGTGTGSSGWTASPTLTGLTLTTLLVNGSSTLQNFTFQNATGTSATTTNLFSSGFASTTLFRANSEVVGDSNIGRLTVTSCVGCSASNATWYFASSTAGNVYKAKTLSLSAGDMVYFGVGVNAGVSNSGGLGYRISAPNSNSSTTVMSNTSNTNQVAQTFVGHFMATTTETVTFERTIGDSGASMYMWVELLSGLGFSNSF